MRRIMGWAAAGLAAITMIGCATSGTGSQTPCEKCDYGYVYLGKRAELKKWCNTAGDKPSCCIKDGKIYDCSKNPAECPECAKNAGK